MRNCLTGSTAAIAAVLGAAALLGVSCRDRSGEHVEVTAEECVVCHRSEFLAAQNPPHDALGFSEQCGNCHDETHWLPATGFDHSAHFPLEGAHDGAACTACHAQGFEPGQTPNQCVGCHRADYEGSPFPGHDRFPTTCQDCHGTAAWKPAAAAGIDHDRFFPLENAHAVVECMGCHRQGFEPGTTPRECVGCHRDDYDRSPFPGHAAFPTTCQACHGTAAWKPATAAGIDHDRFFPLENAHAVVECMGCHRQGFERGTTPRECVGCHRDDYDRSPYPGHTAFPTTCADCHGTSAWTPASGGHPENRFRIGSGPHREVACLDCHNPDLGANGKGNADCVGCHTGEHTRARMDEKHREERGYPSGTAPPNFCLDCHADGSKE